MLAIKEAYQAGLLRVDQWRANILAGIIVGIVALPLSMAFAIASGVQPEQGLYTAIIAGVIVSIFGGSRVQIAGPTGAFVVLLAGVVSKFGVEGLQVATLMAGFMLVLFGLFRFGKVLCYIPDPVIAGFTSGIAVIIFFGQWKDFFGLTVESPIDANFHHKMLALTHAMPSLNWHTTLLATISLATIIIVPKIFKRIPGALVAMVVATVIHNIFKLDDVATLGTAFGGIPDSLPSFQFPSMDLNMDAVLDLVGPAFTIALLGAIESLLCAAAADGMMGTKHHSNQELIGQGIANIVTPLFGGFAATGAFARTATNIRSGGTSPIAGIVHAIFLIAIILLLAPLAANIPLCSLAAVLFVVAYNMSDIPHFKHIILHAPRYDIVILLATFLLTIFTNIVVAVNIGVVLAMLFFVRNMTNAVDIKEEPVDDVANPASKDVLVYSINGPMFFSVAEKIEHTLKVTHTDPKVIILRLQRVPFIDMTAMETFIEVLEHLHKRGIKIYLCEANWQITKKLEKTGALKYVEGQVVQASLASVYGLLGNSQTARGGRQVLETR